MWRKCVLFWRLRESEKEVGPGRTGKRLWTRMQMTALKAE